LFAIFSTFLLSATASAETWETSFGRSCNDSGRSVQQTDDGGYIIAGGTYDCEDDHYDVYLAKTDKTGELLWTRIFGGPASDSAWSVVQADDGGYVMAGYTYSYGAGGTDILVIKTDKDGNELWSKTFGGTGNEHGYSILKSGDGGYVIAGNTSSIGSGLDDVYLIKTDGEGNELWSKTFGGIYNDWANEVRTTIDGGYVITGRTGSFGADSWDAYLIKTDGEGNELWSNNIGEDISDECGYSIQPLDDGGYIIVGERTYFVFPDILLIKTDDSGNKLWSRTFGGSDSEIGYSVKAAPEGGYVFTGYAIPDSPSKPQVFLTKTDESGNRMWSKNFGDQFWESGYALQNTEDGGYIITGYLDSWVTYGKDVYLIYHNPYPLPDIKANGSDGPLYVTAQETVNISVSLDPVEMDGVLCDWRVLALSSSGLQKFVETTWPLFEVPETSLFETTLSAGWWIFLFILDDKPDFILDRFTWFDSVVVISEPGKVVHRKGIVSRVGL